MIVTTVIVINNVRQRNWARVNRILAGFGERVGRGVYACDLTPDLVEEVLTRTIAVAGFDAERVWFLPLCDECARAVRWIGGCPDAERSPGETDF